MTTTFLIIISLYTAIKIRAVLLSKDKHYILRGTMDTDEQYINDVMQSQQPNVRKDYHLYKGNDLSLSHQEIESILDKYVIYYKNLDRHLQFRFFDRVTKFMYTKDFLIYSNEPFKEMPVLISAAAVQISFGLDEYELPHYQYILVRKEEYFAESSFRVLAGNVKDNSITLAWNHLLKGFYNYEDGSNVGLHEMAHALYFQEIIIEKDDADFSNHFNALMQDGETILQQKQCPHQLYSSYAFSNVQEFWAVSVELFFEKAPHLQNAYPNVYSHLQNLLKQNPLVPNQPVS